MKYEATMDNQNGGLGRQLANSCCQERAGTCDAEGACSVYSLQFIGRGDKVQGEYGARRLVLPREGLLSL